MILPTCIPWLVNGQPSIIVRPHSCPPLTPFPMRLHLFFLVFAWVPDGAEIEEDRGLDKGGDLPPAGEKELLFCPEWEQSATQTGRGGLFIPL